jgi:hypothetical protein
MTNLLLFLVLLAQVLTLLVVWGLDRKLDDQKDFSVEDKQVKDATEQIRSAKERLPKTTPSQKDK